MDARRARAVVATGFALVLLMWAWVAPVAAATCALNAPQSPRVGTPLTIDGTGFPVSTAVDISVTIGSVPPDEFSVQSDAAGAFVISLTPEETETGPATVVATAGASCTAEAEFTILGVNEPEPPRTDMAMATGSDATGTPVLLWSLAALTLIIGVAGLGATRLHQDR